jgi:catechol 2,3-dioxygenase-like lactoylglutathione lyase family enzyme
MDQLELGWPVWIGVVAEDLEAQRRFYRDTLQLKELEATDDWIEFDMGGRKFELLRRIDTPQYAERRYQVGFAVPDIRAVVKELEARGVERISEIEGGPPDAPQYWCYFRDPEGNVFEITQRA